jgi:hypothetical protein
MPEHRPTVEELRFLADRAIANDRDHLENATGRNLDWLIAQLSNYPIRVDEECTMCLRFMMISAASTLRVLRDLNANDTVGRFLEVLDRSAGVQGVHIDSDDCAPLAAALRVGLNHAQS